MIWLLYDIAMVVIWVGDLVLIGEATPFTPGAGSVIAIAPPAVRGLHHRVAGVGLGLQHLEQDAAVPIRQRVFSAIAHRLLRGTEQDMRCKLRHGRAMDGGCACDRSSAP